MDKHQQIINLLHNSSCYYIITVNMEGQYNYVNQHYDEKFSGIHGSIIGQPYHITMHPDDTNICAEVAAKCFAHPDEVFPATIRKHDGKGGFVITQWEYSAIVDENHQPAGIFCLGYDITQMVVQQSELSEAKTILEKNQKVLADIAWSQSHLIRHPLTNILGLISLLENVYKDDKTNPVVEMLKQSALELDAVIKKIVFSTNHKTI